MNRKGDARPSGERELRRRGKMESLHTGWGWFQEGGGETAVAPTVRQPLYFALNYHNNTRNNYVRVYVCARVCVQPIRRPTFAELYSGPY